MKKVINIVISIILFLSSLTLTVLPNVVDIGNSRTIVYTTSNGSMYHTSGCGSLWASKHARTLVSVSRGSWGRCSRCHPPEPNFAWYWKIGLVGWLGIGYATYGMVYLCIYMLKSDIENRKKIHQTTISAQDAICISENHSPNEKAKNSFSDPSFNTGFDRLSRGQRLWYRNKKTGKIESVCVISFSNDKFIIDYLGKPHELGIEAIGSRLFFSIEEMQKKSQWSK